MLKTRYTLIYVSLMTLVVVASNFLVQFPLDATIAGINTGTDQSVQRRGSRAGQQRQ